MIGQLLHELTTYSLKHVALLKVSDCQLVHEIAAINNMFYNNNNKEYVHMDKIT